MARDGRNVESAHHGAGTTKRTAGRKAEAGSQGRSPPFFEAAADVARGHPPPDAMQRPSATTWLQGAREARPTPQNLIDSGHASFGASSKGMTTTRSVQVECEDDGSRTINQEVGARKGETQRRDRETE